MLISGTTQACGQMLDWLEGAQPVEPGRGWAARRGSVGAGGRPSATAGWLESSCYVLNMRLGTVPVTLLQISPQSQVVLYNCIQVQLL